MAQWILFWHIFKNFIQSIQSFHRHRHNSWHVLGLNSIFIEQLSKSYKLYKGLLPCSVWVGLGAKMMEPQSLEEPLCSHYEFMNRIKDSLVEGKGKCLFPYRIVSSVTSFILKILLKRSVLGTWKRGQWKKKWFAFSSGSPHWHVGLLITCRL